MTDHSPPPGLDELGARLADARRGLPPPSTTPPDGGGGSGGIGFGFRVSVDLVAAIVVGVGGGLLLDRWLGTRPWGLIVFFFLGAGAGVMNVYRAITGMGYAVGYGRPDDGRASAGGAGDGVSATKDEGEGRRG